MPIEVPVKESIAIEEGKHTGEITDVKQETRGDEGYTYIDVHVTVDDLKKKDGKPVTIKAGHPATISLKSGLGKLIQDFGCTEDEIREAIEKEENIDIEKFIKKGMPVTYMTKNEKSKDGGLFAVIVDGTLRPAK